jgi:hypothetical protein
MADFTTISTLVISCLSLIATILLHVRLQSKCCGNDIDIDPVSSTNSTQILPTKTTVVAKADEP